MSLLLGQILGAVLVFGICAGTVIWALLVLPSYMDNRARLRAEKRERA